MSARGASGPAARVVEAPRLRLVPFREEHFTGKYVGWLKDPDVVRQSNQRFETHTLESCRAYVRSFDGTPHHLWAIVARDPALGHVGNVSAFIEPHHGTADVGMLIGDRATRALGFGSEVWVAVRDWLFEVAGMRKVCIGTTATRRGMVRRLTRLGMIPDGLRKDQWGLPDGTTEDIVHMAMFRDGWLEWRRTHAAAAQDPSGGGPS